jgi:uncharacterized protein YndB with AHSA1/START domain
VTEHPGTVEWVDGATGEVTKVEPVERLPESLRFAAGPDGEPRPVVRIVVTANGDEREIRQHGPDGELLRTTFGTIER